MGETNSKRGMIGSAVTAVIVIALIILGIVFSEFKLSEVQAATMKTLLRFASIRSRTSGIVTAVARVVMSSTSLWRRMALLSLWP